jgi:uncharacterized membrane protein YbaN (DUF454 family)
MNLYKALGLLFVGLGLLGSALPLLPTVPFLLVAAACFARSSERHYQWLLDHSLFGPLVREWEENRCIRRRERRVAVFGIVVIGGCSVLFFISNVWLQAVGVLLILIAVLVVLRLDVCEVKMPAGSNPSETPLASDPRKEAAGG